MGDLALAGFPKGREPANHPYRKNKNRSFTGGAEKANPARSG
jgi:hypothetical protein